MTDRRYPLEPIAELLNIDLGRIGPPPGNKASNQHQHHEPDPQRHGLAAIAAALGISHHYAQHLRRNGLTENQADRYACRLGHHPGTIWPDWWHIDFDNDAPTPDDLAMFDIDGDPYDFAS